MTNDLPTVYALIHPKGYVCGTYRRERDAKGARTQMDKPELKVIRYVANDEVA